MPLGMGFSLEDAFSNLMERSETREQKVARVRTDIELLKWMFQGDDDDAKAVRAFTDLLDERFVEFVGTPSRLISGVISDPLSKVMATIRGTVLELQKIGVARISAQGRSLEDEDCPIRDEALENARAYAEAQRQEAARDNRN